MIFTLNILIILIWLYCDKHISFNNLSWEYILCLCKENTLHNTIIICIELILTNILSFLYYWLNIFDDEFTFNIIIEQAKFLFMVRDGRATVHSIISRHVTITGFNLSSYRQCMGKWNVAIEVMYNQCKEMGPDRCMMVSTKYCTKTSIAYML